MSQAVLAVKWLGAVVATGMQMPLASSKAERSLHARPSYAEKRQGPRDPGCCSGVGPRDLQPLNAPAKRSNSRR